MFGVGRKDRAPIDSQRQETARGGKSWTKSKKEVRTATEGSKSGE